MLLLVWCGGLTHPGLAGAGVSKLPSLELLECREFVREMELPGGVDVRLWLLELGGGVTFPPEFLDGEEGAELLNGCWKGSWVLGDGSACGLAPVSLPSSPRLRLRRVEHREHYETGRLTR